MAKSLSVRKEYIAICTMLNSDEKVDINKLVYELSLVMDTSSPNETNERKNLVSSANEFRKAGFNLERMATNGNLNKWKDAVTHFKENRLKPLQRLVKEIVKDGYIGKNGELIDESKAISYEDNWVKGFDGLLDLYLLRVRNSRIEKRVTEVIQGCLNYSLVSQIQEWIKEREDELRYNEGELDKLPEYVISLDDSLYESGSRELISEQRILSRLAYCIIFRKAVTILYNPHFLNGKSDTLIFSPEHLRRVGYKWMVYGISKSDYYGTSKYVNLIINRIVQIRESNETYIASGVDYSDFKNQMTFHSFTVARQNLDTVRLKVVKQRIKSGVSEAIYPFTRIQQEPLHASQQVIESEETEDFGVVELQIKDADFIYPMLLSWGADIEVLAPESLRQKMQSEIIAMRDLYNNKSLDFMK